MDKEKDSNNIYSAERILKHRKRKNCVEYYIKWKDWSPRWNSWEPHENILDNRLIQEYNRRLQQQKRKTLSSASTAGTSSRRDETTPKTKLKTSAASLSTTSSSKKAAPKSQKRSTKKPSPIGNRSAASSSAGGGGSASSGNGGIVNVVKNRSAAKEEKRLVAPLVIKIFQGPGRQDEQMTSGESSVSPCSSSSIPVAPPRLSPNVNCEKKALLKRVVCNDQFQFTNRTLTDVRIKDTTVTIVEM